MKSHARGLVGLLAGVMSAAIVPKGLTIINNSMIQAKGDESK